MKRVALIVGGGISREIAAPVLAVVAAAGARVEWDRVDVPTLEVGDMGAHLDQAVAAVERCGVGLKTRLSVVSPATSFARGHATTTAAGDPGREGRTTRPGHRTRTCCCGGAWASSPA